MAKVERHPRTDQRNALRGRTTMLLTRLKELTRSIRDRFSRKSADGPAPNGAPAAAGEWVPGARAQRTLLALAALAAACYGLYSFPPVRIVERGELGVRTNVL